MEEELSCHLVREKKTIVMLPAEEITRASVSADSVYIMLPPRRPRKLHLDYKGYHVEFPKRKERRCHRAPWVSCTLTSLTASSAPLYFSLDERASKHNVTHFPDTKAHLLCATGYWEFKEEDLVPDLWELTV